MIKRIGELDSIRGLAALIVLFHHMYQDLNNNTRFPPIIFRYSPLRVLTNGHASVIMFFILSGFVLSLPFLKGKEHQCVNS